jgi:hypothetical protein
MAGTWRNSRKASGIGRWRRMANAFSKELENLQAAVPCIRPLQSSTLAQDLARDASPGGWRD